MRRYETGASSERKQATRESLVLSAARDLKNLLNTKACGPSLRSARIRRPTSDAKSPRHNRVTNSTNFCNGSCLLLDTFQFSR